ncbi:DUF2809 domain-containing protein [Flavobacterium sp. 3HN19-14]|uniref:ribosomal maturation YjgA family protein n=1 Tax=Flavobacterium sp. 3HN19-14 TaxID=3448133 RepID=UPI003EE22BFA
MNKRLRYFTIVLVVVGCGILSRQIDLIPLCIGDMLYAVMVYFGCCFLLPWIQPQKTAIAALLICFVIEISQLYQAEWLVTIRKTYVGHYALGEGFLWSDLLAYIIGILTAFCIDLWLLRKPLPSK